MNTIKTIEFNKPSPCVLDATLRDGGLCNQFRFSDAFVKALYETNIACGVQYMEFGYRADTKEFSREEFGKWKFCTEEDLRSVVGENKSDMKIAVMADVGRCDYKNDFLPKSDSVVDLVRVACYAHQLDEAIDMIEHFHKLGYETSCNVMAVSTTPTRELEELLPRLCRSSADFIYLVDSYGAFHAADVISLMHKYTAYAAPYGKKIGIHAHNNQNLAFSNTVTALENGASFLDATMMGMGRGAGNCAMEQLLGYLDPSLLSLSAMLDFLRDYMIPLKESGIRWGYDLPYLITGLLNTHPRAAIQFTSTEQKDCRAFLESLQRVAQ